LIVKVATNEAEIKDILFHKDIYKHICGNKIVNKGEFNLPETALYIGGFVDNEMVAVACYHQFKDGLKYHPNVLKKHRRQYAREFVDKTLSMIKCKLYIEIPNSRKDLYNLAKKVGFDSLVNNKTSDKRLMRLEE